MINNNNREKQSKNIVITLGKNEDEYHYITDTLADKSKIKIPLAGLNNKETKGKLGGSADFEPKIEKISQKTSNGVLNPLSTKQDFNHLSSLSEKENILKEHEDVPLLTKIVEANLKNPLVIPSCSQWFKFDEIHEIEQKALPEFFCGKFPGKTPEVYRDYRNYIINLFRENSNSYLSATTCRKYLSGDVCSLMRIHAFLEHWGLINFSVDSSHKPSNPILPKVFNFKSPVYIDFSVKNNNEISNNQAEINKNANSKQSNSESKGIHENYNINNNNKNHFIESSNGEVKLENAEDYLNKLFLKNSLSSANQTNFLDLKYRPKCDSCSQNCDFEWYCKKSLSLFMDDLFVVCVSCFDSKHSHEQSQFELVNVYNLVSKNEEFHETLKEKKESEKWNAEEKSKLIGALEKYGENWNEIVKVFNGKKTKQDCILQFMQIPINENLGESLFSKKPKKSINNEPNTVESQVIFFAKMFEKYTNNDLNGNSKNNNNFDEFRDDEFYSKQENLKEIIYKTYAKSIDQSNYLKKREKKAMKKIMNLLIYLQMKKIEFKLHYFNDFDKLIQLNKDQIKTIESQVISDRLNLALMKIEISNLTQRIKDNLKINSEYNDLYHGNNIQSNGPHSKENGHDIKILDLN